MAARAKGTKTSEKRSAIGADAAVGFDNKSVHDVKRPSNGGSRPPENRHKEKILFTDMRERNKAQRSYLSALRADLKAIKEKRALSDSEERDLDLASEILKNTRETSIIDPLFVAIRAILEDDDTRFGIEVVAPRNGLYDVTAAQVPDVLKVAFLYGLLEADRVEPPRISMPDGRADLKPDQDDPKYASFGSSFFSAFGWMDSRWDLLRLAFSVLRQEGDNPGDGSRIDTVKASELAQVVRELVKRNVTRDEPQIRRRVNEALDFVQNVGNDLPPSTIGISLPDLEAQTDTEIQKDNIFALQPIYFSAMFDELKVFQVRDKLAELFQNGILPIGKGHAGDMLYAYWKETAKRMTEAERRSFYARTLGIPGGDDGGLPNREFSELWLRFVSAVSSFMRQNNVDRVLRATVAVPVSDQMVRKSGRDLAVNLSMHGYGMAHCVATELQQEIGDLIELLSDTEIKAAYGARDMWQVIDQVGALELGGARNSVKYRTMATSGAIVMAWLATHARELGGSSYGDSLIRIEDVLNPAPLGNAKVTTKPRTVDLVNACDQWLAVTGTEESRVEQYAQPHEAPMMTSRPIGIPAIAREMLESAGVPAMSLGRGFNRYER